MATKHEKRIETDPYGKKAYKLTRKDKKLVGKPVIYRLNPHSLPQLGHLESRNPWDDWELGCWLVRDHLSKRLFCLAPPASWRMATEADVERMGGRKRPVYEPTRSEEAFRHAIPEQKADPKGSSISDAAAERVRELAKEEGGVE